MAAARRIDYPGRYRNLVVVRSAVMLGQHQQPLRQPRRERQKSGILDHRAGPAQPLAQQCQHCQDKIGIGLDIGRKMGAVNAQQVRLLHRRRARRPRTAVEQGDLTEQIALLQHVEHDLGPFGRVGINPYAAREDAIKAIALIALAEDQPVRLEPRDRREFDEVVERPFRHGRNQKMLRQQLAPYRRRIGADHPATSIRVTAGARQLDVTIVSRQISPLALGLGPACRSRPERSFCCRRATVG